MAAERGERERKKSIFVVSEPNSPIWKMKDLAVGQRVIPTSHMSRVFGSQVFEAALLPCLGKAFSSSVSRPLRAPATAKGGQSNQETTGDGRQERAPNETRFKAGRAPLSQPGERQRRGGVWEEVRQEGNGSGRGWKGRRWKRNIDRRRKDKEGREREVASLSSTTYSQSAERRARGERFSSGAAVAILTKSFYITAYVTW